MLTDYLCVESCRGCGKFIPPIAGRPVTVCASCWDEHEDAEPLLEHCLSESEDGALLGAVLVASGTTYTGIVKRLIYRLKYDGDKIVVADLARLAKSALDALVADRSDASNALVVPIPLHWMRMVTRGYNQADLIAEGLLREPSGLKLDRRLLSRRRFTRAQHGLGKDERRRNLADAFRANRWAPEGGQTIVLVDDIYTSGATIAQAADVLRRNGFGPIYAVTVARAVLNS